MILEANCGIWQDSVVAFGRCTAGAPASRVRVRISTTDGILLSRKTAVFEAFCLPWVYMPKKNCASVTGLLGAFAGRSTPNPAPEKDATTSRLKIKRKPEFPQSGTLWGNIAIPLNTHIARLVLSLS